MKKAILAITLVLCMLPMVFAAEGAMYVGIEPKLQLPSYDLTKGDQITGLGFGIGLDVGYQTDDLWSAGFRGAFEFYFPREDEKESIMIPVGLRFAKEVPFTETFSMIPFLGTGALINVSTQDFRPYIETGLQLQFYYDEKWNFFVGYDANFSFNKECILTQGVSLGFRFYPNRDNSPLEVGITKDGNRIKIDVPAIIFDPNLETFDDQPIVIKRQNKKVLDTVAKLLKSVEYKEYNVTIEAYANAVLGTDEEKPVLERLSQGRADTVKAELIRRGVKEYRLNAVGKGARNSSNAASNRRAEFILEK